MLSDNARKLLRILWSTYGDKRVKVDMRLMIARSQRNEKQIRAALNELKDHDHIILEEGMVQVIEPWEQHSKIMK